MGNDIIRNANNESPLIEAIQIINARLDVIEGQQRKDEEEERRNSRSQLRVNRKIAIFTGLLFVTSLVSDIFLIRQTSIGQQSANAATDQIRLSREQMIATLSAEVLFTVDLGDQKVRVNAQNYGHSIATKIGGKMSIERFSLPRHLPMTTRVVYDVHLQDLDAMSASGQGNYGASREYEIPGFTTKNLEAMMRTEETVTVDGTFTYDNGFGGGKETHICLTFIGSPPMLNINGATTRYSGFIECQQLSAALKTIQNYKSQKPTSK